LCEMISVVRDLFKTILIIRSWKSSSRLLLYNRFFEIIKSDHNRSNYWKKRIHLFDRSHFETDDFEKLRKLCWKKCKFLFVDRFLLHMFVFWMSMLLNVCSIRFANQINHIYRRLNLSKQKQFRLIIRKHL
jgi:hypothetical protein